MHWCPKLEIRAGDLDPDEQWVMWRGQMIDVERTPGQLGGWRMWLACPECRKHFRVLHADGNRIACRHCLGLAYQCQSETADDRLLRKANKLRARLGWESGVINPPGGRPKYMRWAIYERLRMECLIVSHRVLMNYSAWVKSHSGMRRCEYPK